jgi:RNA binding exosome subunit
MLRTELEELWGKYCDTDELVTKMIALLTKYHHPCTENGVCEVLNEYFANKNHLIEMFMKSDGYIGNMRICIDVELARNSNPTEIKNFCEVFPGRVGADTALLKYVDESGKTLKDYTRTGVRRFKASKLHYGNIADMLTTNVEHKKQFRPEGYTCASYAEYGNFVQAIYAFKDSPTSILSTVTCSQLTQNKINGKLVSGMKTSRAFNRVCAEYGVDKLDQYNKLFAQYADMVSGLKRKMKFYISLNPLDYLTMSFGNSWSSCHTIDKKNERGMPNSYRGMYCGGTLSYMLDETSIITYVHNHATEDHEEGKVYRNMFHYYDGTLIQGRIYPQGNDGATDLYSEFRHIVQSEFTKLLGLSKDEWIKRTCKCDDNTSSYGVHYRDYLNYTECNVSYPKEMPMSAYNTVPIGHERICVNCGCDIDDGDDSGMLNHYDCLDY